MFTSLCVCACASTRLVIYFLVCNLKRIPTRIVYQQTSLGRRGKITKHILYYHYFFLRYTTRSVVLEAWNVPSIQGPTTCLRYTITVTANFCAQMCEKRFWKKFTPTQYLSHIWLLYVIHPTMVAGCGHRLLNAFTDQAIDIFRILSCTYLCTHIIVQ